MGDWWPQCWGAYGTHVRLGNQHRTAEAAGTWIRHHNWSCREITGIQTSLWGMVGAGQILFSSILPAGLDNSGDCDGTRSFGRLRRDDGRMGALCHDYEAHLSQFSEISFNTAWWWNGHCFPWSTDCVLHLWPESLEAGGQISRTGINSGYVPKILGYES